jgi:hypothetical protein
MGVRQVVKLPAARLSKLRLKGGQSSSALVMCIDKTGWQQDVVAAAYLHQFFLNSGAAADEWQWAGKFHGIKSFPFSSQESYS